MLTPCSICSGPRQVQFSAEILSKYTIDYLYCKKCGCLQTEEPYWLDEAYENPITKMDVGLVARNVALSRKLTSLLYFGFGTDGHFLDVGGGYGMFTRLMRDVGFDYYWSDPFCENMFAKGFDASKISNERTKAVTAFEVMEHLYQPLSFIRKSLEEAQSETFIFSQDLFYKRPPAPESWWYYTFPTGQHITFYQPRTIAFMARQLGLKYYCYGNLQVLTKKSLPVFMKSILRGSAITGSYVRRRMKSLLIPDMNYFATHSE